MSISAICAARSTKATNTKLIRTVRGLGYTLDIDQRPLMFRSVTSRLVLFYCVLLVLLGGAFLLFTVLSFQHYTRETVTRHSGRPHAGNLEYCAGTAGSAAQACADHRAAFRAGIAGPLHSHPGRRTADLPSGDPSSGDFSAAEYRLQSTRGRRARQPDRQSADLFAQLSSSADGSVITVDSGQSYQFARTVQQTLATSLFIGLPILLLLAALAGYVLMRRALTPVEVMINAAETYSFNDPHKRLPLVGTEPRIEALGLALNRMLDRLDSAYSHVSRFSADAAHELRTPLTIIRGELELVMAQAQRLPSDVEQGHQQCAGGDDAAVSGIVDSLITLSRMDSLWGKRTHSQRRSSGAGGRNHRADESDGGRKAYCPEPAIRAAGDRRRRPGPAEAGSGQSGRQRHQIHAGGRPGVASRSESKAKRPSSRSRIAASASIPIIRTGCSIASIAFRRTAAKAAPAWAWRSSNPSCHAHGGTVALRSVPEIGQLFPDRDASASAIWRARSAENKVAAAEAATATGLQE